MSDIAMTLAIVKEASASPRSALNTASPASRNASGDRSVKTSFRSSLVHHACVRAQTTSSAEYRLAT